MTGTLSFPERKNAIRDLADRIAPAFEKWRQRNDYFHVEDERYTRFLATGLGGKVLDLGCGNGDLLASLEPEIGLGIDFSKKTVEAARARHPDLEFKLGDVEDPLLLTSLEGPFDLIVLSDTIGELEDVQSTLLHLHALCHDETRIIIAYHSQYWGPLLKTVESMGLKRPSQPQNWLSSTDIAALLDLAEFDIIMREWRQLIPLRLFGLGRLINRFIAPLPFIRKLCVRSYLVARSTRVEPMDNPSATVVIPCRNEKGNVEPAINRMPPFCDDIEVIFVEGGSSDGTWEEIERVIAARPDLNIKAIKQPGKGKGDAVRAGFVAAGGDILMIQDADLTAPPEDLPKFYNALASRRGDFINGTRLIYPMDSEAMRFLNLVANNIFSLTFSWLLNQRFTDTLCGTKVLTRENYVRIAENRSYFGEFDPFGDFDLILGAARLNMKVEEIPVRYRARQYGSTQISRFRHGLMLLRMTIFAFMKLKAI
jgi:SAM-dependent methyltransferase